MDARADQLPARVGSERVAELRLAPEKHHRPRAEARPPNDGKHQSAGISGSLR